MKPSVAGRPVAGRVIAGVAIVSVRVGMNRRPSLYQAPRLQASGAQSRVPPFA